MTYHVYDDDDYLIMMMMNIVRILIHLIIRLNYHVKNEDDDQVDAGSRDGGDEAGPCLDDALRVTIQNGRHHNPVQDDRKHGR